MMIDSKQKTLEEWKEHSEVFLPQENTEEEQTLVKYHGKWRVIDRHGISLRPYDMCTPFFAMHGGAYPRAIVKCKDKYNVITQDETLLLSDDEWGDYISVFDLRAVSWWLWKFAGSVFRVLRNDHIYYYDYKGEPVELSQLVYDARRGGYFDFQTYIDVKSCPNLENFIPAPWMFDVPQLRGYQGHVKDYDHRSLSEAVEGLYDLASRIRATMNEHYRVTHTAMWKRIADHERENNIMEPYRDLLRSTLRTVIRIIEDVHQDAYEMIMEDIKDDFENKIGKL